MSDTETDVTNAQGAAQADEPGLVTEAGDVGTVETTEQAAPATTPSAKATVQRNLNTDGVKVPVRKPEATTKLFATGEGNHRQAYSAGGDVFAIILANPGIDYATFSDKAKALPLVGTAANVNMHFNWDLAHGRVRMEFEDGTVEVHPLMQRKPRVAGERATGPDAEARAAAKAQRDAERAEAKAKSDAEKLAAKAEKDAARKAAAEQGAVAKAEAAALRKQASEAVAKDKAAALETAKAAKLAAKAEANTAKAEAKAKADAERNEAKAAQAAERAAAQKAQTEALAKAKAEREAAKAAEPATATTEQPAATPKERKPRSTPKPATSNDLGATPVQGAQ